MSLQEIILKTGLSVLAIQEAQTLLVSTYGEGCLNLGGHPDSLEINQAARTLIVHLSWLKARAVTQSLMAEASDDAKKKFGNLIR